MSHVIVLLHRDATFNETFYFLNPIVDLWREAGHSVTIVEGIDKFVPGDVAILHVDLTVVPEDHLNFMELYPSTINAGVADISKRAFSTHLVSLGDNYDGPVIVKTDLNYGGLKEAILTARRSPAQRVYNGVRKRLHWSLGRTMDSHNYKIFESSKKVPWPVWNNSNFIVEKFQPERRGNKYCLRSWVFLGSRESSFMYTSESPIVKGANFVERIPVDVPDELRQWRKDLNFDFGKFDYAVVDDKVVLYDVNRTPTLGTTPPDIYMPRIKVLAEGLQDFL